MIKSKADYYDYLEADRLANKVFMQTSLEITHLII